MAQQYEDRFSFFRSYHEVLKVLPDNQRLALSDAIREFAFEGKEPDFEGTLQGYFRLMRPVIAKSVGRAAAGSRGGNATAGKDNNSNASSKRDSNASSKRDSNASRDRMGKKRKEGDGKEYSEADNNGFAAFWDTYPRKRDRGQAYRKYIARLKDGYTPGELLTAARNYAAACERQHTEERYIKYGATFLGDAAPFEEWLGERKTAPAADLYALEPGVNPYREVTE